MKHLEALKVCFGELFDEGLGLRFLLSPWNKIRSRQSSVYIRHNRLQDSRLTKIQVTFIQTKLFQNVKSDTKEIKTAPTNDPWKIRKDKKVVCKPVNPFSIQLFIGAYFRSFYTCCCTGFFFKRIVYLCTAS